MVTNNNNDTIILPLACLDLVMFVLQKSIHIDLIERSQTFNEERKRIKGSKFNFILLINT